MHSFWPGKDAFHRVPDFHVRPRTRVRLRQHNQEGFNFRDAVERVRTGMLGRIVALWMFGLLSVSLSAAGETAAPDFAAVQAVFNQHCLDCHAAQDPEAQLVMEDFESLMKGGENGPVLLPGKSDESLLVRMIEGKGERDGKNKIMPPGKRKKLEPSEIETIK